MITYLPVSWFSSAHTPLIFGHRGASCDAPENTMTAFQAALSAGADGVELDVHLTQDGIPVVIHNDSVDATTDGSGDIEAMLLQDVLSLDAGSHYAPGFAGERIPLLRDVLGTFAREMLINIELKPSKMRTRALAEAVAEAADATNSRDRIWCSSFDPLALTAMNTVNPDIACGFLYSPLTRWRHLFLNRGQFGAIHPHHSLVTQQRVINAHKLGQRVVSWTVDQSGVAERLRNLGVDVLISNNPAQIREALKD